MFDCDQGVQSLQETVFCPKMTSIKCGPSDLMDLRIPAKRDQPFAACFPYLSASSKRRDKNIEVDQRVETTKKAKLVVGLKTSEGEVIHESRENVSIQFTPEGNAKVEEIHIRDGGEIIVNFTPLVSGILAVNTKVNGHPVYTRPIQLYVKRKRIQEITGHSKLKCALNTGSKNFRGVAINKLNSKIAIADCDLHCVRVYNMEGDLLLTYGRHDGRQEQFNNLHGLAFLDETDLVIADTHNHRICIINTTTGKLVRTFGCNGNADSQFNFPSGVHVDNGSNIFVCDEHNKRVQVFTKDGDYLYKFSVPGFPYSVVTHNGQCYVGYYNNTKVCVVEFVKDNLSLTTVITMGTEGYPDTIGDPPLSPHSLAIDNDNNFMISDISHRFFHIFTLDAKYVGFSSQLANRPYYIAVLNDGHVICTLFGGGGVVLLGN